MLTVPTGDLALGTWAIGAARPCAPLTERMCAWPSGMSGMSALSCGCLPLCICVLDVPLLPTDPLGPPIATNVRQSIEWGGARGGRTS